MRRLRVLTWNVHGSYMNYLARTPVDFFLPVMDSAQDVPSPGYGGRIPAYDWPDNVIEIPRDEVRRERFDLVLYQSADNFLKDRHEILSDAQRRLPQIYLEHDPPRNHPTDTRHAVDDPEVLLVHVTHFNALMWDTGRTPTTVIEHGVAIPEGLEYVGDWRRGVVVVNDLRTRGRRLGFDIFEKARATLPLDLYGMGWREAGGRGELAFRHLHARMARYRLFFNPIRYTSLGLAVLEAMTLGMPILGLATTELASVVENGRSGYIHTDPNRLLESASEILDSPALARKLGHGARTVALERFGIGRFTDDWTDLFHSVAGTGRHFLPQGQPHSKSMQGGPHAHRHG